MVSRPTNKFNKLGAISRRQEGSHGNHTKRIIRESARAEADVRRSQQGGIALSVQPKTVDTGISQEGPRWQEALQAGRAPLVVLRATYEGALNFCSLADLKRLAVDLDWHPAERIGQKIADHSGGGGALLRSET